MNDEIKQISKTIEHNNLTNINLVNDHYNIAQTAKAPTRTIGY